MLICLLGTNCGLRISDILNLNVKDVKNKKTKPVKKVEKTKKESYFNGLKKELKLVKWPEGKEIVKYTIATVVFCIIFVAFFELLNLIMAFVKGLR